jgi:hypothetical protein
MHPHAEKEDPRETNSKSNEIIKHTEKEEPETHNNQGKTARQIQSTILSPHHFPEDVVAAQTLGSKTSKNEVNISSYPKTAQTEALLGLPGTKAKCNAISMR